MGQKKKATAGALAALIRDLTEPQRLVLVDSDNRPRLRDTLDAWGCERVVAPVTFTIANVITPLEDWRFNDGEWFGVVDFGGMAGNDFVRAFREGATSLGVPREHPILWHEQPGIELKRHLPLVGPCVEDWKYLQRPEWALRNDTPTVAAILACILRILPNSTSKNPEEQLAIIADWCKEFGLPPALFASFGSAVELGSVALGNHAATGECHPRDGFWFATDTFHADGYRIILHWHGPKLSCSDWDEDRIAVPLGRVALGHSVT